MRLPTWKSSLLVSASLLLLAGAPLLAQSPCYDNWTNETFAHVAVHLDVHGKHLWVGTGGGGVLDWDTSAGTYEKYTRVANCLASNWIADIAVDPVSGDVWAATDRGLSRLPGDGSTAGIWELYVSSNSPLGSDLITAVAAEDSGVIWVGTYDAGLYRIENGVWTRYDTSNSDLSDNFVTRIVIDDQNRKWIGVWGAGVDLFDDAVWANYDPSNTWPDPPLCNESCGAIRTCPPDTIGLISFFADPLVWDPGAGEIWIHDYDDGLCFLNGVTSGDTARWRTFTEENSTLPSHFVADGAVDVNGDVWLASQNGAQAFDGNAWRREQDIRGRGVIRLGPDLWFATPFGVQRYDGRPQELLVPGGLQGARGYDLALDPADGSAWIATEGGLHKYDGATWQLWNEANSDLPSDDVRALLLASDGALWIGMQVGGVARFDGGNWQTWDTADGLCCPSITTLEEGPDGRIWAAYQFGGVSVWDGISWQPGGAGLPSQAVSEIARAPNGDLWFGTPQGATRFDASDWTTFTTADGLPHNSVRSVHVPPGGSDVWIGTFDGVSRYDGSQFTNYTVGDNVIVALGHDAAGNVWAGARDAAVGIFDGTDWRYVTYQDGLVFSRVLSIAGGVDARVWIGTEFGLSVYEPSAAPGIVPDGAFVAGPALRVAKPAADPSLVDITWSPSCNDSVEDYALHEGTLGDFTSHISVTCSTGGLTAWSHRPASGGRYFLVTALADGREGGSGFDSELQDRPLGPTPCSVNQDRTGCP